MLYYLLPLALCSNNSISTSSKSSKSSTSKSLSTLLYIWFVLIMSFLALSLDSINLPLSSEEYVLLDDLLTFLFTLNYTSIRLCFIRKYPTLILAIPLLLFNIKMNYFIIFLLSCSLIYTRFQQI